MHQNTRIKWYVSENKEHRVMTERIQRKIQRIAHPEPDMPRLDRVEGDSNSLVHFLHYIKGKQRKIQIGLSTRQHVLRWYHWPTQNSI